MPKVSIGMPIYNGETYLEETLESIVAQEYDDFELVVSDNVSTDRTPEILAKFATRDPRLRIVRQEEHVSAIQNATRVMRLVNGEYSCFMADDDVIEPSFLRVLAERLDSDPGIVIAYSWARYIGDADLVAKYADPRRRHREPDHSVGSQSTAFGRIRTIVRRRAWIALCGLIRTDVLRKTRLFHEPMGIPADAGLVFELCALGRFACVAEGLLARRLHHDSLGRNAERMGYEPSRSLDPEALEFLAAIPVSPAEHDLVEKELGVWCWKTKRPRPLLGRSGGLRSTSVRVARMAIDLEARLRGVAID